MSIVWVDIFGFTDQFDQTFPANDDHLLSNSYKSRVIVNYIDYKRDFIYLVFWWYINISDGQINILKM